MTKRSQSLPLLLLSACLTLQGCDSVRSTLGFDRTPPDEFVVTPSHQPLEMPPDFSYLPVPMPGMERPQDRAARQAHEEKFLGTSKGDKTSSAGQEALLNMCGVQPNQDQIRSTVDTEARMEDTGDKTIVEKLGIKKSKPKGDAINPYEEAEKLKDQGLPAYPTVGREIMKSSAERAAENHVPSSSSIQAETPFHF